MPDWKKDAVYKTALSYCKLRLLPFDGLGYDDTSEYGVKRSHLHNYLCTLIDADREVVEHAFAKVESKFGFRVDGGYLVDGSAHGKFDFAEAYDAFCRELERIDRWTFRQGAASQCPVPRGPGQDGLQRYFRNPQHGSIIKI